MHQLLPLIMRKIAIKKLTETLINCLCGMKRKAHRAQQPYEISGMAGERSELENFFRIQLEEFSLVFGADRKIIRHRHFLGNILIGIVHGI